MVHGGAKLDSESKEVADALEEAAEHLDHFGEEARDDRPPLHRAATAVVVGRALIGLADPVTTSKPTANEVRETSESLRNQLSQAVADGGGTITGPAEDLLTALSRLRHVDGTEQAAKEAALRFRQSLDPRLRSLKREVDRIETVLNDASESAGAQAEGLSQRLDVLKGEINNTEARVSELISDQDSKFTEAQEERRKEFAAVVKGAEAGVTDLQKNLEKQRGEVFERLDEIKAEVADTAAAIGGRATSFGHGAESIEQEALYHRWSFITIALLIGAALVPISFGILKAKQSPESVIGKAVVALLIAGVASYTAGVARHHRDRAAHARRMELEMTSFDPFVAPLDRDDRDDLRSTIVWRFFGPEAEPQEPDSPPRHGRDLREILHLKRKKRDAKPTTEA